MAQVFDSRNLLPSSFGEESLSRESCAWSCGEPSRLFRCVEKSMVSSSCEAELGCSRADNVGFVTLGPEGSRQSPGDAGIFSCRLLSPVRLFTFASSISVRQDVSR